MRRKVGGFIDEDCDDGNEGKGTDIFKIEIVVLLRGLISVKNKKKLRSGFVN